MSRSLKIATRMALAVAGVLFAACAAMLMPAGVAHAAQGNTVYIKSSNDLIAQALASRTVDTTGVTYVLDLSGEDVGEDDKTLDLTEERVTAIVDQIGSLTFGTKDNPFKGTFDGNGYTIKGLNYERSILASPDTGLFAWTKGATIKNLTMTDAYVGADYRGGVLVGYAENTRIENVKLVNCTSSVTPANNAVSLVTNAGLAGGMVAGEAWDSTFYNVEVQGGSVINNATAAVSGLGGEGLYLGGIVGIAKNSTIEYCRVTPIRTVGQDGTATYTHTRVHNKYDIAVGAVSGQAIYAGGIAGSLYDGAEAIDCFSTADCYTYGGTYVSVGAGNVGYTGGIVARTDDAVLIERCHYAGNLHSKLYNALLVIPIIQYNIRLGGIIERDDDSQAVVRNSYYGPHFSAEPDTNKDIPAIYDRGGDKIYAGASFGAQDDAVYRNRAFWEGEGFDFAGGTQRVTKCLGGQAHVNKWVMNYELGIPVHGDSVKATFDFPGAGSVEIGSSDELAPNNPQTTKDPFAFAVQGFVASDLTMDFKAAVNSASAETTPSVSDFVNNQGYRFVGWYREPLVDCNEVEDGHAFFDPIVGDSAKKVSAAEGFTAQNRGPGVYDSFAGNDLFVAAMEAQVRYHDVAGNVIDTKGAPDATGDDDWYKYQDVLPDAAEPQADRANGVSEKATLAGWTTVQSPDGGGWKAISASDLGNLRNQGEFYTAGSEVTKPMDLYPVYVDYISNIITVCEGNELDDLDDPTTRKNVATTNALVNGNSFSITVKGTGADGALPEGYRFLGWYETDDTGTEWRVSSDATFRIPADVDLSKPHTYTARFEYCVDGWLPQRTPNTFGSGEYGYKEYFEERGLDLNGHYASVWLPYKATGADIATALGSPSVRTTFHHWTEHANMLAYPAYADGHSVSADELNAMKDAAELPALSDTTELVTGPLDVDAIVEYHKFYDVTTFTDFPGCTQSYGVSFNGAGQGIISLEALSGYRYSGVVRFSNEIGNNPDFTSAFNHNYTDFTFKNAWSGTSLEWKDSSRVYEDDYQNIYLLKASADINFYDLDGNKIHTADSPQKLSDHFSSPASFIEDATATRKYQSLLFNPEGQATVAEAALTMREVPAPSERNVPVGLGSVEHSLNPVVSGAAADPKTGDDTGRFIYRDGSYYGFLGWVCPDDLSAAEMAHAFVDSVPTLGAKGYVATSAANAVPYLLVETARVSHSMEIYPVYAKFDIETTTNVARIGVPEGSGINIPANPIFTVSPDGSGVFSVSLTADIDTLVGQGTTEKYRLTSFTVERDDGTVETLTPTATDKANQFTYKVRSGEPYVFVAYYEPLAVSYHVSDTDVSVLVKNKGESLGAAPDHRFVLSELDEAAGAHVVFAGWTQKRPESGSYVLADAGTQVKLVKPTTVVNQCMELFPVFYKVPATVGSNIDDTLKPDVTDLASVRDIVRTTDGALMLQANEPAGYQFLGWYKGYVSDAEKGTLVSSGNVYALPTSSLLEEAHYTAVFQAVHEVRYHDTEGNVIYTAEVVGGSGRSFVTTQTNDAGATVEVLEDIEAWQKMATALDAASSQPDAAMQELMSMWQWVKPDGTTVAWADFCREPIASDMDLYPVTYQVSSYDASDTENTQDLYWALDSTSDVPVKAYFKQVYDQSKLTIHVATAAYAPSAEGAVKAELTPVTGANVGLHASALQGEPWVKATDAQGDAVFEFAGSLKLTKQTSESRAAGSTFSFKVVEMMSGDTRTVTLTLPKDKDTDGMYRAEVTLDVPVGRYRIVEDASWAWRYNAQLESGTKVMVTDSIDVDVLEKQVQVVCTNTLSQGAWLDASAHITNKFAAQGGGA